MVRFSAPGADHIGEVQAWNVDTGERVWTHLFPTSPTWGSMLATAGGLVFTGGTNDRKIRAFDAVDREAAVGIRDRLGHRGAAVDVLRQRRNSTWRSCRLGRRSAGMNNGLNRLFPGQYPEAPEGGAVWVFALP